MSAVAATIVQPKLDYRISDDGKSMTYYAKSASRAKGALALLILMPVIWVLVPSGFALLLMLIFGAPGNLTGPVFLVVAACGGFLLLVGRWGGSAKITPIHFTEETITVRDKSYLLKHVTYLGWRASGGYVATSGSAAAGAALGHGLSGVVYIQYGDKEIPLVTGLHPNVVERVYSDIAGFLNRVGYNF